MIAFIQQARPSSKTEERFLEMLPTIRRVAQHRFRYWDAESRDDAVTEVVANCFVAFARLVSRGKTEAAFATVLARFAISQFRAGRRVGTKVNAQDVLSPAARRRSVIVERLDRFNPESGEWSEAIVDDTTTPVADQAAFRCDFPAWLARQTRRKRRIAEALSLGHTTGEVARRFRVSEARVSQLRRELHDSWESFHGKNAGASGTLHKV